jgi:hypothetical protein
MENRPGLQTMRSILFEQHVALECVFHLKLKVDEDKVLAFLNDTGNFHNQVSAARAMVGCNSVKSKMALSAVICDTARNHFVQVLCIRTLSVLGAKELKIELKRCLKFASDDEVSFGGGIMDPRVCTHMPSVHEALSQLIEKL